MGSGRRQQDLDTLFRHTSRFAIVSTLLVHSKAVHGQDCWQADVLFPEEGRIASPSFVVHAGADAAFGYVPPFRAGARDRIVTSLTGSVRIAPVELRASWGWLADTSDASGIVHGPGDVRLGTVLTFARPGDFTLAAGWEAKLPNAADEGELGTDETDVTFGATAGWARGPLDARLGVGLAVLGNPLRFANQDDVPLIRASLAWDPGLVRVIGRASADLPTSRNPARIEGDVGLQVGSRWFGLVHGGGGFVPASADWHVGLAVGFASPLPIGGSGV